MFLRRLLPFILQNSLDSSVSDLQFLWLNVKVYIIYIYIYIYIYIKENNIYYILYILYILYVLYIYIIYYIYVGLIMVQNLYAASQLSATCSSH